MRMAAESAGGGGMGPVRGDKAVMLVHECLASWGAAWKSTFAVLPQLVAPKPPTAEGSVVVGKAAGVGASMTRREEAMACVATFVEEARTAIGGLTQLQARVESGGDEWSTSDVGVAFLELLQRVKIRMLDTLLVRETLLDKVEASGGDARTVNATVQVIALQPWGEVLTSDELKVLEAVVDSAAG